MIFAANQNSSSLAGTPRGGAGPASDRGEVWDLIRSIVGAGEQESANLAQMANQRLRTKGIVFDFDCRMMAIPAYASLSAASIGTLYNEEDIRSWAKHLLPHARKVVRADQKSVSKVLRTLFAVGGPEGKTTYDTVLFLGGVLMGIACEQAGNVGVDSYRDDCIRWFDEHWPQIAQIQLP